MERYLAEELKQIGKRIKMLRIERGIHQLDLANKLGISQTNMSNIECGRTGLTLLNLIKIHKILGCDITEFFRPAAHEKAESKKDDGLELSDVAQILKMIKNSNIKGL